MECSLDGKDFYINIKRVDNFNKLVIQKYAKKNHPLKSLNTSVFTLKPISNTRITQSLLFKNIVNVDNPVSIITVDSLAKVNKELTFSFKGMTGYSKKKIDFDVEPDLDFVLKVKDRPFEFFNYNLSKRADFIQILKILKEKFKENPHFILLKVDIAPAQWLWKFQYCSSKESFDFNKLVVFMGLWHPVNIISATSWVKFESIFFLRIFWKLHPNNSFVKKPKLEFRNYFFKLIHYCFQSFFFYINIKRKQILL